MSQKMDLIRKTEEFEIWKFQPDLLHAFPFYMERVRLPWRIRCVFEYFVGYNVFYFKAGDQWLGYCVVSSGKNPRYHFATEKDIICGRYFVAEAFRGRGLGAKILEGVLNNCGVAYERAFAYLRVSNIPSVKTMEKIGAVRLKRFNIKGFARKLYDDPNGEFVLYEYKKPGRL